MFHAQVHMSFCTFNKLFNIHVYCNLVFSDLEKNTFRTLREGKIYVSFYLPNDDPSPHFRWSDVVPGKFIAILFPCIHSFRGGSVGLRVDKATYAYIFDIKD